MTESIYKEYQNKYYNPNDNDKRPGDNDNWKSIQKGFHDISEKQLETSAGLTLGKGTEDETSVTAAELDRMKDISDYQFRRFVAASASVLDGSTGGIFVTPNDLNIVSFVNSALDPSLDYSFIIISFDKEKIPFALELTFLDPVSGDETITWNGIAAEMGRSVTDAKIYFKPAVDGTEALTGYVVGIFAVGVTPQNS